MSAAPRKKGSWEHPAVQFYNAKIGEVGTVQLPALHALNERLRRLSEPPPSRRPTEPAPPDTEESEPVVQVPETPTTEEVPTGPPAPETP